MAGVKQPDDRSHFILPDLGEGVHEAPLTCGFGAEIAARIMERCFLHLEAPVQRVAGFDTIMPYYKLELDYMPDAARIGRAIDDVMAY